LVGSQDLKKKKSGKEAGLIPSWKALHPRMFIPLPEAYSLDAKRIRTEQRHACSLLPGKCQGAKATGAFAWRGCIAQLLARLLAGC